MIWPIRSPYLMLMTTTTILYLPSHYIMLIGVTPYTHLFVLFFRLSMSSLRKRKPSWCAVWVGGWGTAGLLWAGADLDLRAVMSPASLGRGRRRGLGLSRARGRSGREDFSGKPLGRRGTSPRAWEHTQRKILALNYCLHFFKPRLDFSRSCHHMMKPKPNTDFYKYITFYLYNMKQ